MQLYVMRVQKWFNSSWNVQVGLGLTAGTLGCCVNIPFDVAKSRIQGPQPEPGRIKYRGTASAILTVFREEGWVLQILLLINRQTYYLRFLALYKGLVPKIMRLGPGGAIMLLVYEHVHEYLVQRFPDWVGVASSTIFKKWQVIFRILSIGLFL